MNSGGKLAGDIRDGSMVRVKQGLSAVWMQTHLGHPLVLTLEQVACPLCAAGSSLCGEHRNHPSDDSQNYMGSCVCILGSH